MPEIKLRPLKTKDIFPMSRILKKIGIKETMKSLPKEKSSKGNEKEAQTQFGYELLMTAIENLHLAETEVNGFLADLTGMKPEEFSELEFSDFLTVIDQFKGMKGISGFLQHAAK